MCVALRGMRTRGWNLLESALPNTWSFHSQAFRRFRVCTWPILVILIWCSTNNYSAWSKHFQCNITSWSCQNKIQHGEFFVKLKTTFCITRSCNARVVCSSFLCIEQRKACLICYSKFSVQVNDFLLVVTLSLIKLSSVAIQGQKNAPTQWHL